MTEDLVRLDRPTQRYTDLELHFRIAQAVDALDAAAWVEAVKRLYFARRWRKPDPAEITVTRAMYDALHRHADPDSLGAWLNVSEYWGLRFTDLPIIPVED